MARSGKIDPSRRQPLRQDNFMSRFNIFQRVSQAPTNPKPPLSIRQFDVAELYQGPIQLEEAAGQKAYLLDEKLRQAYFWIVNNAIISPHYDIEYNDGPNQSYVVGDTKKTL